MQNTTQDSNGPVPPSDDEALFYRMDWPFTYTQNPEEDILDAFMSYINGLDPIAKERAIKKLKVFLEEIESSLCSFPEELEVEFNLPRGCLTYHPPQSLRFDN